MPLAATLTISAALLGASLNATPPAEAGVVGEEKVTGTEQAEAVEPSTGAKEAATVDESTGAASPAPVEEPAATDESKPTESSTPAEEPAAGEQVAAMGEETDIQGSMGFQVSSSSQLYGASVIQRLPTLGVRYWGSESFGWEAGLSAAVVDHHGTSALVGFSSGFLWGLARYKHMVVYFEPMLGFHATLPDRADNVYVLSARLGMGAEIRLGMFELPRVGVTLRMAVGIDADLFEDTRIVVGTAGANDSAVSAFEGAVGFVIYI